MDTRILIGKEPNGTPIYWDWYRDPNVLMGAPAGWGKSFTCKGILRAMKEPCSHGREGGRAVFNPKRLGYYEFAGELAHEEWKSDFQLSNAGTLWVQFSRFMWALYDHRMAEIEKLEPQGVDEFLKAGFAPFVVVIEELQGFFQSLEKQELDDPKAPKLSKWIAADLNCMTALFRASGIRFVLVSQAMTAEGGIPTKTKTNCTAKVWLGPIDDGSYVACFGTARPPEFRDKYRPVLGTAVCQWADIGTRIVQIGF